MGMVFSRDLLAAALLFFNSTKAWRLNQNFAIGNFGRYLRFAWAREEAAVFDDSAAIVAPRSGQTEADQSAAKALQHYSPKVQLFEDFCRERVFGHLIGKDSSTMYQLYKRSKGTPRSLRGAEEPRFI